MARAGPRCRVEAARRRRGVWSARVRGATRLALVRGSGWLAGAWRPDRLPGRVRDRVDPVLGALHGILDRRSCVHWEASAQRLEHRLVLSKLGHETLLPRRVARREQ